MRILFVTPRLPSPPLKGDQARVYGQLWTRHPGREVSRLSLAEVSVAPDDRARMAPLCREGTVVTLPRLRDWWNLGLGRAATQAVEVYYYQAATVAAGPLRCGSGIQTKVFRL